MNKDEIREKTLAGMLAKYPWHWAHLGNLNLGHGLFKAEGHEYQLEPMNSESRRLCVCKATQMTFTESFVIRNLHKCIHGRYKTGALYLMPTVDEVRDFSQVRFTPLIDNNPELIGKFVSGPDSAGLKKIGNAFLYFRSGRVEKVTEAGQKSSSKLKNIPVDAVTFDELDEMNQVAIRMALARMNHSEIKDESYLGNPTIPGFGIDEKFHEGDQRYWELKCDACGHYTNMEMEFPNCLKRDKDGKAFRACVHCGKEISPRRGLWVPSVKANSGAMHSYTISQLNSSIENMTEFLGLWENPDLDKQQFYNLKLGRAYQDARNQLTPQMVFNLCSIDPMLSTHWGPTAMGVDVGNKLHCVIGCKHSDSRADILWVGRLDDFTEVHEVARKFNVKCAVVDFNPERRTVKKFREIESYPVFGCEYSQAHKYNVDYDTSKWIVKVNRDEMLDKSHDYVMIDGKMKIPGKCSEIIQFATEMCNVVKTKTTDEFTQDVSFKYRSKKPDHYRHATNYFLLALARVGIARRNNPLKSASRDRWTTKSEVSYFTGI